MSLNLCPGWPGWGDLPGKAGPPGFSPGFFAKRLNKQTKKAVYSMPSRGGKAAWVVPLAITHGPRLWRARPAARPARGAGVATRVGFCDGG